MNYSKILSSAYNWISLNKTIWFLVFFWLSLPVIMFLPGAISAGAYPQQTISIVLALYSILYLGVLVGLVVLIQFSLKNKRIAVRDFSPKKLLEMIILVVVEVFYALIWGVNSGFRVIQLLLIILSAFLFYYYLATSSALIYTLFIAFASAYLLCVLYNAVRIFFATTVFCKSPSSIIGAIEESTALTHGKFYYTFSAIAFAIILSLILFFFITISLGFVSSLLLNYFFITPVSLALGFRAAAVFALAPAIVAYHFSLVEIFAQLSSHHESNTTIKRILASKVLHKAPARKLAKKKPVKKKRR